MVTLHVFMKVSDWRALESTFREIFAPAMSRQPGFVATRLLREFGSDSNCGLEICFRSEEERQAWVDSADHAAAWPEIEALSKGITWRGYDVAAAFEAKGS